MSAASDAVSGASDASVAGAILAAGASTRLGQAKQLVKLASGDTLIDNAVRALRGSRCAFRAVVLGARRREIEAATDLEGLTVIANDAWPTGMASSIQAAVAWADSAPVRRPPLDGLRPTACR